MDHFKDQAKQLMEIKKSGHLPDDKIREPKGAKKEKWDGERAIAFVENGKIIRLQNQRLQDISTRYPEIIGSPVEAEEAILDGEIALLEKDGKSFFSKLA